MKENEQCYGLTPFGGEKGQALGTLVEDTVTLQNAHTWLETIQGTLQLQLDLQDSGVAEGVGVYGDFNDPNAG